MNSSLSLSIELIYLMGWLLKNDKSKLSDLVKQAMNDGLAYDLERLHEVAQEDISEHLHKTVLNFLSYMEEALAQSLDQFDIKHDAEQAMMPALNNLEDEHLNDHTVRAGLQQAKAEIQREVETKGATSLDPEHAKRLLFKHILENWNPKSEETLN